MYSTQVTAVGDPNQMMHTFPKIDSYCLSSNQVELFALIEENENI
jgi:hypothetical protein